MECTQKRSTRKSSTYGGLSSLKKRNIVTVGAIIELDWGSIEQFHDSPSYLLHSSKMISRIIESVEGDIGLNDIVDTKVFPGNLG